MKIEWPWRRKRDPGNDESLKQLVIDVLGLLILGVGLPWVLWFFATQNIGPLVDFFRTQ